MNAFVETLNAVVEMSPWLVLGLVAIWAGDRFDFFSDITQREEATTAEPQRRPNLALIQGGMRSAPTTVYDVEKVGL